MADVFILRFLVTFLLIIACWAGLPSLDEDGMSSSTQGPDAQRLDDHISIEKIMVHQPRYKCHQCDSLECESSSIEVCHDALYCFKSSLRASDGDLRHIRGCSTQWNHYRFICGPNTPQHSHRKRRSSVKIICCQGNMCNDGDFPELPLVADTTIEPLLSNMKAVGQQILEYIIILFNSKNLWINDLIIFCNALVELSIIT